MAEENKQKQETILVNLFNEIIKLHSVPCFVLVEITEEGKIRLVGCSSSIPSLDLLAKQDLNYIG